MAAIRIATFLSIIFFFVPMLLVADTRGGQSSWKTWLTTLGLIGSLVYLSPALSSSSVAVHSDAPALGAACMACWITGLKERLGSARSALLAGCATAVSVMAKQNLIPLIVALGIWWLLISWRSLLLFAAALTASLGAIWVAVSFFSTSLHAAWLDWFQIPTHQPYSKALLFPVVDELARQLLLYILPLAPMVMRQLQSARVGKSKEAWLNTTILLLFVGCWLIPTSILGRIKTGGNINALSPAIYFFALACSVELSAFLRQPSFRRHQGQIAIFSSIALVLMLGGFIGIRLPELVYSLAKDSRGVLPMESVYRFSLSHPGQIYFPQFPLTVLMAEGNLYTFSWGLTDRRLAGYPVSASDFVKYTPPFATSLALVSWVPEWDQDVLSRCIAGRGSTTDSALPGFTLCSFR
jgi:hypothetical protein